MIKIGLVCKRNLVRSKFLALFLSRSYPNFEFWSAGTNVLEGARFDFDRKLLKKFDLPIGDQECRSINNLDREEPPALLLVADKSLQRMVRKVYPDTKMILLDEIGELLGLQLRDPIGFTSHEFEVEICKYTFAASYAMNQFLELDYVSPHQVEAIIPKRRTSFDNVITQILKAKERKNTIVLHSGIGTTTYLDDSTIKSFPIPMTELGSFSKFILENPVAKVFHFEYEAINPVAILTSCDWRFNILQIRRQHNVLLYSTPYSTSKSEFDPISLFGTLPSLKISIV